MKIKITNKTVEDVVSEVAGEDVIPLVKILRNKKNLSEFTLADRIKKEINLTRNMLYRLYEANLVSFLKKKDKKKGWYIYYWTFNANRIKDLVKILKKQRLDSLKDRLEREKRSQFFICSKKCIRLDIEQASDFEFKCPECNSLLNPENNAQKIKDIEKEISALEKELKERKR